MALPCDAGMLRVGASPQFALRLPPRLSLRLRRGLTPQGLAPAFEGRCPAVCLAPVVGLLERQTLGVESQDRRPGERHLLAVFTDDGPPLDRGAVARPDRVAHPYLGLSLLRPERPPCVLDRAAGVTERMRAMHRSLCVHRSEQV